MQIEAGLAAGRVAGVISGYDESSFYRHQPCCSSLRCSPSGLPSTDTTDSSTTTPSSSLSSPTKNPTDKHSARIPAAAAQNGVTHKCGVVEGQGTLYVKESTVPCTEAKGIINIYLRDSSIKHEGNASVAHLGDWTCSTSTAAVAKSDGYSLSCTRSRDPEMIVIPF